MKQINKLSVRIVVALLIGFLFAGALTKITYPCEPTDGAKGCLSFEKAIMHPNDLINNRQNSLVKFSQSFATVSVGTFVVLGVRSLASKKRLEIGK